MPPWDRSQLSRRAKAETEGQNNVRAVVSAPGLTKQSWDLSFSMIFCYNLSCCRTLRPNSYSRKMLSQGQELCFALEKVNPRPLPVLFACLYWLFGLGSRRRTKPMQSIVHRVLSRDWTLFTPGLRPPFFLFKLSDSVRETTEKLEDRFKTLFGAGVLAFLGNAWPLNGDLDTHDIVVEEGFNRSIDESWINLWVDELASGSFAYNYQCYLSLLLFLV